MSQNKGQAIDVELREPAAEYARNKAIPVFFGQPLLKGDYTQIDPEELNPEIPVLFYSHPNGEIWVGDAKTSHPTQKPEELLRKIVLASSNPGDLIIDPFLGSGTTAVVAEQLKRKWKGCDISWQYCQWAAHRIELVEDWPIEKWIAYDTLNNERRKSIHTGGGNFPS
ncbi:MAG: hypothetical protein PWQ18_956 [Clostridia bacterium]|nr:hypothetical protein [Clostridia bacterium]